MPTPFDHALVALLAVAYPLYAYTAYQRFERDVSAGRTSARVRWYLLTFAEHTLFAVGAATIWVVERRPVPFQFSNTIGFWIGLSLALTVAAALAWQLRITQRDDASRDRVRQQVGPGNPLLVAIPRTPRDLRAFTVMAFGAGVFEEMLYRGYLIWYVGEFFGLGTAVAASSLVFGMAHVEHGVAGAARATVVGAILASLYLGTGSLWVPILLHTAIDFINGRVLFEAFRSR